MFNKSLPNNLTKKLKGVTTKKKITNITIGAITLPRSSPNFIQILLSGFKNSGLKKAKIVNINAGHYISDPGIKEKLIEIINDITNE